MYGSAPPSPFSLLYSTLKNIVASRLYHLSRSFQIFPSLQCQVPQTRQYTFSGSAVPNLREKNKKVSAAFPTIAARCYCRLQSERLIVTPTYGSGSSIKICRIISLLKYFALGGARLPLGMLNHGRRKSPSPTPPLRRLSALTVLAMGFRINSMCLTSSSPGTASTPLL
jgi:hypothetical protein